MKTVRKILFALFLLQGGGYLTLYNHANNDAVIFISSLCFLCSALCMEPKK